ncbi:MAG: hypothetical protein AAGG75_09285 [Bacteroidota bacterium]
MRTITIALFSFFALSLLSCGEEATSTEQADTTTRTDNDAPAAESTAKKQPANTQEGQLQSVALHLLGGFLVTEYELQGDLAKLTYATSLEETNAKGNTSLSPDKYWETAKRLDKYFPLAAYSIMDELSFVNHLEATIPYDGKTYLLDIKRADFEEYVGHSFAKLKENPHELFHYIHVRSAEGRQKFADRFVKIQ